MEALIRKILEDIDDIDQRDVLKESIEYRLNKTLKVYAESIDQSYRDLLDSNYNSIIRNIVRGVKRK